MIGKRRRLPSPSTQKATLGVRPCSRPMRIARQSCGRLALWESWTTPCPPHPLCPTSPLPRSARMTPCLTPRSVRAQTVLRGSKWTPAPANQSSSRNCVLTGTSALVAKPTASTESFIAAAILVSLDSAALGNTRQPSIKPNSRVRDSSPPPMWRLEWGWRWPPRRFQLTIAAQMPPPAATRCPILLALLASQPPSSPSHATRLPVPCGPGCNGAPSRMAFWWFACVTAWEAPCLSRLGCPAYTAFVSEARPDLRAISTKP